MRRLALLFVALLVAASAAAETIPLDRYIQSLEAIRSLLASNQLDVAKTEARLVMQNEVESPHGKFAADAPLLTAVVNAKRNDRQLQARLALTIAELRRATPDRAAADRNLLKRVAAEEDVPEYAPGGELPTKLKAEVPLLERIARALMDVLEWIGKKIEKLIEWIFDLFPRGRGADGATSGINWMVMAMVALIALVIVVLAFEVIRRSSKPAAAVEATSEPIGSRRDEDPLSRGASEWERYAAQLAAAGRMREAIRAWYHAVLVACYAAGVLQFRKGRTNWEYVAALSPSIPWRPELIQLTRRFEQEWYGSDVSSEEALDECSRRATRILDAVRRAGRGAA